MQGRRGSSRKDTECGGCGSGENMWRVGMGRVLFTSKCPVPIAVPGVSQGLINPHWANAAPLRRPCRSPCRQALEAVPARSLT